MKKISLAVLLATSMVSGAALADNQTVSLGYAQSKLEDFKNLQGTNLQYRYEASSPISFLGSFTYLHGNGELSYQPNSHADAKYYSVMAGPAYRINDAISLYALGGVAFVNMDGSSSTTNGENSSKTFVYGAGVSINPHKNLSLYAGFERTEAKLAEDRIIQGFNVGAGYRF